MIELLLQAEASLAAGQLERAEALYRQVVEADPRNAIALVGLARVAAELSDEVGALTFARRALAIDPEDNAARRTVQRLEEVLGGHGVSATAAGAGPVAAAQANQPASGSAAEPSRRSHLDRLLRRHSGGG